MNALRTAAAALAVLTAFSAVSCGKSGNGGQGKEKKAATAAQAPTMADIEPDTDYDGLTSTLTFTDKAVTREEIEELCKPSRLETLVITGGSFDASGLDDDFSQLSTVDISGCELTGFEALAELPALTSLRAAYSGVTSVTCLDGKEQLVSLDLSGSRFDSLAPFGTLKGLEELSVNSCGLDSLEPFGELTGLKALYAANNSVTSLGVCAGMPSLQRLSFDNNDVTSLEPLAGLEKLEFFSGADNGFADISALADSSNSLMWVTLDNAPVTDLEPLRLAYNLRYLSAAGCGIKSLMPLSGKFSLKYLDLCGNGLTALDVLDDDGCPKNIKAVFLDNNSISDPSLLTLLTSAEIISAADNLLDGALMLPESADHLRLFDVSGNPITSVEMADGQESAVHDLAVFGCPLESFSKDIYGYDSLWYSSADTLDMSGLTRSNYTDVFTVDCPDGVFEQVKSALSESMPKANITNITEAQAREMLSEKKCLLKAELRSDCPAFGSLYEPSSLSHDDTRSEFTLAE